MNEVKEIIVTKDNEGQRLDLFCNQIEENLGRKYVKELIKEGSILLNNQKVKASKKLKENDLIYIEYQPPKEIEVEPEDIPINILFEDKDVIVINKDIGMVVHPAPGNQNGTLVNALMFHTKDLSGINGILRPGIVHRIDKDTSGILVVVKNDKAHLSLSKQFSDHSINREYLALVEGIIDKDKGTIDMPIGRDPNNRLRRKAQLNNSKEAITHFEVIKRFEEGYTLCKFKLETGRTHQIRVHMKEIGHPLVGDPLYNNKDPFKLNGQFLHARKLGFIHPSKNEYIEFETDIPEVFSEVLNKLTPLK